MDTNAIMQAIQSLGFPIVMCGALFWVIVKQNTQHKEEMDNMRVAIENNTVAITKLVEKMEVAK